MLNKKEFTSFLSKYDKEVQSKALKLRKVILENLPGIIEQLDVAAGMFAYCYGNKYNDLICTIIPSKKGLKLGFNKGTELPDPDRLLEGTGKISRYVVINSVAQINSAELRNLLHNSLILYKERMKK